MTRDFGAKTYLFLFFELENYIIHSDIISKVYDVGDTQLCLSAKDVYHVIRS